MKKERYLHIRLDEETWSILVQRALDIQQTAKPNISRYIRSLIRSEGGGMTDALTEAIHDMNNQIIRIGNNVNQIARSVNTGLLTESQKQHLTNQMEEIIRLEKQQIEEIKKQRE